VEAEPRYKHPTSASHCGICASYYYCHPLSPYSSNQSPTVIANLVGSTLALFIFLLIFIHHISFSLARLLIYKWLFITILTTFSLPTGFSFSLIGWQYVQVSVLLACSMSAAYRGCLCACVPSCSSCVVIGLRVDETPYCVIVHQGTGATRTLSWRTFRSLISKKLIIFYIYILYGRPVVLNRSVARLTYIIIFSWMLSLVSSVLSLCYLESWTTRSE